MKYSLSYDELMLLLKDRRPAVSKRVKHKLAVAPENELVGSLTEKGLYVDNTPALCAVSIRNAVNESERVIRTIHSARTDFAQIDYYEKEGSFVGIASPFGDGRYILIDGLSADEVKKAILTALNYSPDNNESIVEDKGDDKESEVENKGDNQESEVENQDDGQESIVESQGDDKVSVVDIVENKGDDKESIVESQNNSQESEVEKIDGDASPDGKHLDAPAHLPQDVANEQKDQNGDDKEEADNGQDADNCKPNVELELSVIEYYTLLLLMEAETHSGKSKVTFKSIFSEEGFSLLSFTKNFSIYAQNYNAETFTDKKNWFAAYNSLCIKNLIVATGKGKNAKVTETDFAKQVLCDANLYFKFFLQVAMDKRLFRVTKTMGIICEYFIDGKIRLLSFDPQEREIF